MRFADEIAAVIKDKRELAGLDDAFVLEKVKRILLQNKKLRAKIESANSFKELARGSEFKAFVKKMRAELRAVYGVFDIDEKRERQYLQQQLMISPNNTQIARDILTLHQSSKERIAHYEEIYKRIFAITDTPASILDLACGANPYSYAMLGCTPRYLAIDLPGDEIERINEFFATANISGEAIGLDLVREQEKIAALQPVDVCFLFKALDSLEESKRNVSGALLDAIKATWIVVSFPTMSLGGKKHIKQEKRAWFEKLLARRGWSYETFELASEKFYVVCKKPTCIAQQFYKQHAADFAQRWVAHDLSDWLTRFATQLPGKNVLDVGCGTGRDARWLCEHNYAVTGIDLNEELLDIARKEAPKARFLRADMQALPFADATFNGVWCCASLVHMTRQEAATSAKELIRVLKKGGVAFISVKAGTISELARRHNKIVPTLRFTRDELLHILMPLGIEIIEERQERRFSVSGIPTDEFLSVLVRKV